MLKLVLTVLIILVAAVLAYAATKPGTTNVKRSARITASPSRILDLINDFHRWTEWSPYEHRDPGMKRTYSGAPNGAGAVYEWQGNSNVGQGRMEILQVSPSKTTIKLDFVKPLEGHNVAEFIVEPDGAVTTLTWSMSGPRPYIGKLLDVVLNLDRMIGRDFETGLANLKTVAEK